MKLVQIKKKKELPKDSVISIRVTAQLKEEWSKYVKENKIQQTKTFSAIIESIISGELK